MLLSLLQRVYVLSQFSVFSHSLIHTHRGRRVVRGSSRVVVQVWLERAAPGPAESQSALVSGATQEFRRNFGVKISMAAIRALEQFGACRSRPKSYTKNLGRLLDES